MPTRNLVVPGNWACVEGGKWHILATDAVPQSFRESVKSRCGVAFETLNVTGGEAPPTNDYYICKRCIAVSPILEG